MSKAEEKALEVYPILFSERNGYDYTMKDRRESYIKGYNQAEKDLELTWEDIDWIVGEAVCRVSEDSVAEQICKEVLKRFKERKEHDRH